MTVRNSGLTEAVALEGYKALIAHEDDGAVLAPIVAGARARVVADSFERSGTAVILLSEIGSVLHIGESARRLLDGALSIVAGHVVAETAASNRGLERLIAAAVAGSGDMRPIVVPRDDAAAVEVRAIHFAEAADDPMQLMKAILVLREHSRLS